MGKLVQHLADGLIAVKKSDIDGKKAVFEFPVELIITKDEHNRLWQDVAIELSNRSQNPQNKDSAITDVTSKIADAAKKA